MDSNAMSGPFMRVALRRSTPAECAPAEVGLSRLRPPPDPDAVRTALRERPAGFKVPRQTRIVDELPKTATGKIRKPDLRSQYLEESPA